MSAAHFQNEDGHEDVCGGQCNVDCLKPWHPEPCTPAPVPDFVRELAQRVRVEVMSNQIINRLRAAKVAL